MRHDEQVCTNPTLKPPLISCGRQTRITIEDNPLGSESPIVVLSCVYLFVGPRLACVVPPRTRMLKSHLLFVTFDSFFSPAVIRFRPCGEQTLRLRLTPRDRGPISCVLHPLFNTSHHADCDILALFYWDSAPRRAAAAYWSRSLRGRARIFNRLLA